MHLFVEGSQGRVALKDGTSWGSAMWETREGIVSGLFGIIGLRPSAGAHDACVCKTRGSCWALVVG